MKKGEAWRVQMQRAMIERLKRQLDVEKKEKLRLLTLNGTLEEKLRRRERDIRVLREWIIIHGRKGK